MNINNIWIMYKKQIAMVLNDLIILVIFVPSVVIAFMLDTGIAGERDLVNITQFWVVFHVLTVGVGFTASMVIEEKIKNTLRVLVFSTVSSTEFLIGTVLSVVTLSVIIAIISYFFLGIITILDLLSFLSIVIIGTIITSLLGSVVGVIAKSQSSSQAITIVIIFAMFFTLNLIYTPNIGNVMSILFPSQLYNLIETVGFYGWLYSLEALMVLAINLIVIIVIFIGLYKRRIVI